MIQTVDKLQLRPTLRALLYAVFFHRTLTPVEAQTFAFADTHVVGPSYAGHQWLISGLRIK